MKPDIEKWQSKFQRHFSYPLTSGQHRLSGYLFRFLISHKPRCTFLMKGYAGTGKTTMVRALLKTLPEIKQRAVLMAPTGRAAKVLANYSEQPAYTIHKTIYRKTVTADGEARFGLAPNKHKNTLFVVDEASMISGRGALGSGGLSNRNLLDDLMEYVYQQPTSRLLLIGDQAQLPPVGLEHSPALDINLLKHHYDLTIAEYTLTEVIRQEAESGILLNATQVRNLITSGQGVLRLDRALPDFRTVDVQELPEMMEWAYSNFGVENTLVVTRSNWMANQYNQIIRTRVRWLDNELEAGELMMIVKNNYFWIKDLPAAAFIANGDIMEIRKVMHYIDRYDFRFADVEVVMADYDAPAFEVKILLDTIYEKAPSLGQDKIKGLFHSVAEDYPDETSVRKRNQKIFSEDPFFNALQVKFAYAVTCHKAQGGQWPVVFIDIGKMENEPDTGFFRWLYTAITRASAHVFLVNFPEELLKPDDI